MNRINLESLPYFIYIAIFLVLVVSLYFLFRHRSYNAKRAVLLTILFFNLAVHFAKLLMPGYINNFPNSISHVTFENVCAVTTMVMPFVYLIKKQNVLHDYMFFVGCCGGFGAMAYPMPVIGYVGYDIEVIRFYICHISIVLAPILAVLFGVYRPRAKMLWVIPLLFFVQEFIIFVNDLVLLKIGAIQLTRQELLDSSIHNTSLIYGPLPPFKAIANLLIDPLVPQFFKVDIFNINGGIPYYHPIVWMVIPAMIYFPIVYIILISPVIIADYIKARKAKKTLNAKA